MGLPRLLVSDILCRSSLTLGLRLVTGLKKAFPSQLESLREDYKTKDAELLRQVGENSSDEAGHFPIILFISLFTQHVAEINELEQTLFELSGEIDRPPWIG